MEFVIPQLPQNAKCRRCKARGEIRLPSHNTLFCRDCYIKFCETAVTRAMDKFGISRDTDLLVAVSGGKDSLALWDLLHRLGFRTRGLHVSLGIEAFSEESLEAIKDFASTRNLPWAHYSLKEMFGWTIPEIRERSRRSICSLCGMIKRQLLNRLTVMEGYGVLATGHNLDDEAGRLLGNILRNRTQYFDKQYPYLPAVNSRMPAKAKPLYRLESWELRAYCHFSSIKPHTAKCPLSRGATSHVVKEALDFLEGEMPGTKRDFLFSHLRNRRPPLSDQTMRFCEKCGEPAYLPVCSVCNLKEHLEAIRLKPKMVQKDE
jgi:tRNA-5-methyluridine54 2-sulfurtransferase